ncbi:MAG: Na+/H+ antiporter subunit E [Bacteroidetes bacterium]|jgi:multicomponent Na+:H+ antiporter subunit E|nr:Na+/H+ antiporter subunit E [Bacteroidota bacterium]
MNMLALNLALAVVWTLISGEWSVLNFLGGFVIGLALMRLTIRTDAERRYYRRVPQVITFAAYFIYELVVSNLRIAADVLTPKLHMTPSIVAVPLDVKTDLEIMLLANLITLTPGTLSLELSEDCTTLFVHAVYAADPEATVRDIKRGFERRVLEICR